MNETYKTLKELKEDILAYLEENRNRWWWKQNNSFDLLTYKARFCGGLTIDLEITDCIKIYNRNGLKCKIYKEDLNLVKFDKLNGRLAIGNFFSQEV